MRARVWVGTIGAVLASALAVAGAAAATDRVVVKGVTLEGTVKSITPSVVKMETIYGGGEISIDVKEIQSITTETVFHVMHGDNVRTVGPIIGITPERVRVQEAGTPVEIPLSEMHVALRDPGPDANIAQRTKLAFPYWTGNIDLSAGTTQATDDSVSLGTALGLRRERGPHRSRWDGTYRYDRQNPGDAESSTTANELRGFLRQEYSFNHLFVYASGEAEYDEVEHLSLRTIPKAGVGYRIVETETAWLSVDAGGAYVWERFFGGDINQFPAATFGVESDWKLPFAGAVWHTRGDYTPSLEHFRDDYILRGETSLVIPLWEAVSFKVSAVDVYDSTPAEDSDYNSFTTLAGLSYGF